MVSIRWGVGETDGYVLWTEAYLKKWRQWGAGWGGCPAGHPGPWWCRDLGCCQSPCLGLWPCYSYGLYWCPRLRPPLKAKKMGLHRIGPSLPWLELDLLPVAGGRAGPVPHQLPHLESAPAVCLAAQESWPWRCKDGWVSPEGMEAEPALILAPARGEQTGVVLQNSPWWRG